MNFVFDVDGTLTPSRQAMDAGFKKWFIDFCKNNPVYLVTGSDYIKTLEQVGEDVMKVVRATYNCAGNAIYVQGQLVYKSDFVPTQTLLDYLEEELYNNPYSERTGQHIEQRTGLVNFSIVGRGADFQQRHAYIAYDLQENDRDNIVRNINKRFPELEATAGGETGVDIYPKGKDKSQIADVLSPFTFFGDAIYPGGNDYTISLRAEVAHKVVGWEDTWRMLKEYQSK